MKKKAKVNDYEVKSLPATRKEQFFDILRHRYFLLLGLGAIFLVFALPLLGGLAYRDFSLLGLESSELSSNEKETLRFGVEIIFSLIFFASLLVLSVGLSGISKVLRQLLYDEPVFLKEDFFSGIKENFKQYFLLSLILALFWLAAHLLSYFASNWILRGIFYGINIALVFPPIFVAFFLSSCYSNSLGKNIQVGVSLYLKAFPSIFLTFISLYALAFLNYVPIPILKYVLLVLLFLCYVPLSLLFGYCNQIRLYDELINKEQFLSNYHKGLADSYQNASKDATE